MTATRLRALAVAAAVLMSAVLSVGSVQATSMRSDLVVYVERMRAMFPETEVTGRFYDWRSVSRYRAAAGLHLGYDIALNAGRPVPAGWPGRVTAVVPWTDYEWGISVETANGYRVTYGHLAPAVSEGQIVCAGMTVGTVVHDHVDIKVKDRSGGYLDFGQSYGLLDGSSPWANGEALGLLPPPPYESAQQAPGVSVEELFRRYRAARVAYETRKVERDRVRDLVATLSDYIDEEAKGLPQAEELMLAWYRAADANKVSEGQVEALNFQVTARRSRVNRLIYILERRQQILAEREVSFQAALTSMESCLTDLQKASANADRIARIDRTATAAGKKAAPPLINEDIARRARLARERMDKIKERYAQNGAARTTMEEATKDCRRLQLVEAFWQHGDRDAASDLNW